MKGYSCLSNENKGVYKTIKQSEKWVFVETDNITDNVKSVLKNNLTERHKQNKKKKNKKQKKKKKRKKEKKTRYTFLKFRERKCFLAIHIL